MTNNREICALDRHSKAMEDYTAAAKSVGGREIRKERLAIEKTIADKKMLDEAAKVLSDGKIRDRDAQVANLAKIAREDAAALAVYDAQKLELQHRETKLAVREIAQSDRENNAHELAAELKTRETKVTMRESAAVSADHVNLATAEAAKTRGDELAVREQAADAREERARQFGMS